MPPKNKSRNAPNQHDKRHESGLAPPGKRVVKKQSNGYLNGKPDGKPSASVQSPGQSSSTSPTPTCLPSPDAQQTTPPLIIADHAVQSEVAERERTCSDASAEDTGDMADMQHEHAAPLAVVEPQSATFKHNVPAHAGTTLSTIATILSYYPLRDAISILILLLSLPPTLVLVIQTLFASLTFVPPTTSISLSTLPNIKEMFNSPNLGYPALATILIVDLIFWVCWLPVWKPLQGVFLDLSQAVIAVSLSGAAASTGGPTYSIATSTVIVCIVHVLRYKAIHLTALDYLRSVLHKMDIAVHIDVPAFITDYNSYSFIDRGWIYTVIRTILGIHIVSQGVTTCIRRSLVKANEQSANTPAITRSDPEATAGAETNPRPNGQLNDVSHHASSMLAADGRAQGPSLARRDSKPRESTTKKKRKQANQVRSQQPLWAAIASTKVTFVKEMEQRDAIEDARESARMETVDEESMTNLPTSTLARAWVQGVQDSDIHFCVQLPVSTLSRSAESLEESLSVGSGIDKSKPFYVKVNGATWSSTRILADVMDETPIPKTARYDVEVFGLAPLSSYFCEFVAMADQDVLSSVRVITQAAPTPEQTISAPVPPQHQSLRPASPITTLKQSILTAESKLTETRNRTKKSKKDQRAGHADIKREINSFKTKLETSGGVDDKQERRLLQITQHKAQAEEATGELKDRISTMGDIPREELAGSDAKKEEWQSASHARRTVVKDLESAKAELDRDCANMKSEIEQTESKREKLNGRHAQRMQEMEKLLSKQEADMTAKQRRDFDRAQLLYKREKEENEIRSHIASFESEMQVYQQKTHDAYQQMAGLEHWGSAQPPPYPGLSSPPTPDGMLPGTSNGTLGSPQSNGFPPFFSQGFQSPFHSAHASLSNTQGGAVPRGRSSSMLSQYSGFTDNGEEYSYAAEQVRPQYSWPMALSPSTGTAIMDDRKDSEGSGSASFTNGSTGSNSPRPDARAFVPGKPAPGVGTIGPPGKAREKAPQSPVSMHGAIGSHRQRDLAS